VKRKVKENHNEKKIVSFKEGKVLERNETCNFYSVRKGEPSLLNEKKGRMGWGEGRVSNTPPSLPHEGGKKGRRE